MARPIAVWRALSLDCDAVLEIVTTAVKDGATPVQLVRAAARVETLVEVPLVKALVMASLIFNSSAATASADGFSPSTEARKSCDSPISKTGEMEEPAAAGAERSEESWSTRRTATTVALVELLRVGVGLAVTDETDEAAAVPEGAVRTTDDKEYVLPVAAEIASAMAVRKRTPRF